MPELCRFYGITIVMYTNEGVHQTPHFHARAGGASASIAFDGTVIVGDLSKSQLRLVQTWVVQHRQELEANWLRARKREALLKIDPLA